MTRKFGRLSSFRFNEWTWLFEMKFFFSFSSWIFIAVCILILLFFVFVNQCCSFDVQEQIHKTVYHRVQTAQTLCHKNHYTLTGLYAHIHHAAGGHRDSRVAYCIYRVLWCTVEGRFIMERLWGLMILNTLGTALICHGHKVWKSLTASGLWLSLSMPDWLCVGGCVDVRVGQHAVTSLCRWAVIQVQ